MEGFPRQFESQTIVLGFLMFIYSSTLMHFCFSGKYNSWDKVDPAELFSKAPTEKKEANPKLTMVKFLQVFLL